jgi:3-phenylpropionate/trans-cinnamate dioxygenase ferredoxin subunit
VDFVSICCFGNEPSSLFAAVPNRRHSARPSQSLRRAYDEVSRTLTLALEVDPCYVFNMQVDVLYTEQPARCQHLDPGLFMQADKKEPALEEAPQPIPVAKTDDIPPGQMKRIVTANRAVVLANVDGRFYAFEDRCQHWGVRLSDGKLEGCVVRCRAHGWRHDIAHGEVVASEPPGDEGQRIATFQVDIKEGVIFVGARIQYRQ